MHMLKDLIKNFLELWKMKYMIDYQKKMKLSIIKILKKYYGHINIVMQDQQYYIIN